MFLHALGLVICQILLQVPTGGGSVLSDILQTGGTLAVLGFFVMYFMKEQKEVRVKMDALIVKYDNDIKDVRKGYDDKIEMLTKRMEDINERSLSCLQDVKNSNDKLASAISLLSQKHS